MSSEQRIQHGSVFFIALNSQFNAQTPGHSTHGVVSEWEVFQQIAELNKNRYYYYYCVDIRDYVFQKKDGKDKLLCLELPKFVCVKTYIPNYKSFERVLEEIDSLVLAQRCSLVKQYKQISAEALTNLNAWESSLENEGIRQRADALSNLIMDLHEKEIAGTIPAKVTLPNSNWEFAIQYPGCTLDAVEAISAIEQIFEAFSVEEILLCFFCLLNEISLVFIGSNQRQISSAM